MLSSGKHANKKFEEIQQTDLDYCDWVIKQNYMKGDIQKFKEFLEASEKKCLGLLVSKKIPQITTLADLYIYLNSIVREYMPRLKSELSIKSINVRGQNTFLTLQSGNYSVECYIRDICSKLPKVPENGEKIYIEGDISIRADRGIVKLDPTFIKILGISENKLEFEKLLTKFKQAINRKRKPIEHDYKRIGIITSIDAKGFEDTVTTILYRCTGKSIVLYDCQVQGANAVKSICDCIDLANRHNEVDILLLVRGGGSKIDLDVFNSGEMCQSIVDSKIPIVTGIGHTTDDSLADKVAEKSFITPTAVAENVTMSNTEKLNQYKLRLHHILNKIRTHINELDNQITQKTTTVNNNIKTLSSSLTNQLNNNFRKQSEHLFHKLKQMENNKVFDKIVSECELKRQKLVRKEKDMDNIYHGLLMKNLLTFANKEYRIMTKLIELSN